MKLSLRGGLMLEESSLDSGSWLGKYFRRSRNKQKLSLVDDRRKIKAGVQCSATAHDIRAMLWETQRIQGVDAGTIASKFGEHESSVLSQPTSTQARSMPCQIQPDSN